jgi:RecJ-like exonuclease
MEVKQSKMSLIETITCPICRGQGFTSIGIKCVECNGLGNIRRSFDTNKNINTKCKNCNLKKRIEKLESIVFKKINGNER